MCQRTFPHLQGDVKVIGTGFPLVILSAAKDLSRSKRPTGRTDGEIPRLRPRDDRLDVALRSPWHDVDIALPHLTPHRVYRRIVRGWNRCDG